MSSNIFHFLQIIWFTALFPYFVMTMLLFRAITLEGASIGLMRYITPDWDKLYDSETWIDSATQVSNVSKLIRLSYLIFEL